MTYYALSALINGITSTFLGVLVYFKKRQVAVSRRFCMFLLAVAFWSYSYFVWQFSSSEATALFWCRMLMGGTILIPITFAHFVVVWLNLYKENKKIILWGYICSLLFFIFNFTPLFVKEVFPVFSFKYWPRAGVLYLPFLCFWFGYVIYSWYLLVMWYQKSTGIKRNQIRYILIGTMIGFLGGATNYPLWYNIPVLPFGNIFAALAVAIMAYAVIKYRLMDIEIVVNKTVLFGLLISSIFVLHLSIIALLKDTISYVGTTGLSLGLIIFLLFFTPFRRKMGGFVDALVYRGKYDYQKVLKESTKALISMLDLRQLLDYMVNTISGTVGVEKISLFLREGFRSRYQIRASCGLDEELVDSYVLKPNEGIIPWLKQSKTVFIKEEMERALPGKVFESVYGDLEKVGAEFVLPLFYKDNLVGVLNLSNKQSGGIYNQTDIDILESLGAEAAVAIENARLHTEVITDELTELYQPKYFELRLREEIEKAKRYRHCLSLMTAEADKFEEFKKNYGEEKTDKLFRSIAKIIKENLRVGDIACRCGEKLFGIILPEITEELGGNIRERLKKQIRETVEIGERLRRRVKEEELGVTVSIGIASFDGQDRDINREVMIKQAKEALSQAKREEDTIKVFYDEALRKEISTEVLEWIKETEETLVSGDI
ncbi:MAG: diguanylate cyclase, partial [Elusimicrobiota bacterium]|nr:diguanylate cyclase [Elusimicrobiota bacterium]